MFLYLAHYYKNINFCLKIVMEMTFNSDTFTLE
jgi:hypothetical protein